MHQPENSTIPGKYRQLMNSVLAKCVLRVRRICYFFNFRSKFWYHH